MKTCKRKLHQYAEHLSQCPDCAKVKNAAWAKSHSKQQNAAKKAWKKANPEKSKGILLKTKYGISIEIYRAMMIAQDSKCAICKQPETYIDARTKKVKELAVDHCHNTGKIRGLLCASCNTGLGLFKDDLSTIRNIVIYLESKS